MNNFFKLITFPFRKLRAYLRLRRAIMAADDAFVRFHQRTYVLPMEGGGLIVTDRANFRANKRSGRVATGRVSQTPNMMDVERECFYCTPHFNGSGRLTKAAEQKKRREYYRWALS